MIDPVKLRAATKAAEEYLASFALAAGSGTAKTAQPVECEASQSGPKGSARKDQP